MFSVYENLYTRCRAYVCIARIPFNLAVRVAVSLAIRSSRSDLWPNELRKLSARERAVAPHVSNVKVAMSNALNDLIVFKLYAERARRWRRQVPTLYII